MAKKKTKKKKASIKAKPKKTRSKLNAKPKKAKPVKKETKPAKPKLSNPKILLSEIKKEIIHGRERIIEFPREYFVRDPSQDFHSKDGIISKKDLNKKDGSKVISSLKKEFTLLSAQFADKFRRMRKAPQTIPTKDIGFIICETGINRKSVVVDAGLGSGALTCTMANLCKEVTAYDIREDFIEVAKKNIESFGLKNVKIKNKSIYKGIDEKEVDLVTLDLPEPWLAIGAADKALKVGGFLVSYSPTIPQVMDFTATIERHPNFKIIKTVEMIKRVWEVFGRKVRPKTAPIGHSGFLTFVRKIR